MNNAGMDTKLVLSFAGTLREMLRTDNPLDVSELAGAYYYMECTRKFFMDRGSLEHVLEVLSADVSEAVRAYEELRAAVLQAECARRVLWRTGPLEARKWDTLNELLMQHELPAILPSQSYWVKFSEAVAADTVRRRGLPYKLIGIIPPESLTFPD